MTYAKGDVVRFDGESFVVTSVRKGNVYMETPYGHRTKAPVDDVARARGRKTQDILELAAKLTGKSAPKKAALPAALTKGAKVTSKTVTPKKAVYGRPNGAFPGKRVKYNGTHYDALIARLGKLGIMATVGLETMGWTLHIDAKDDLRVMVWHPEFSAAPENDEWIFHYGDMGTGDAKYAFVVAEDATTDLLAGMVLAMVVDLRGGNNI